MKKLMRIHPDDNVVVVCSPVMPGDTETFDGFTYRFDRALGLGHKMAATGFSPGDVLIKFGVPIGSATVPIAMGDHVHLHNIKSDYLSTYTHDHEFIQR